MKTTGVLSKEKMIWSWLHKTPRSKNLNKISDLHNLTVRRSSGQGLYHCYTFTEHFDLFENVERHICDADSKLNNKEWDIVYPLMKKTSIFNTLHMTFTFRYCWVFNQRQEKAHNFMVTAINLMQKLMDLSPIHQQHHTENGTTP